MRSIESRTEFIPFSGIRERNEFRSTKRRGFTLMELLIVIAILALLAAVAIPKLIDVFERSRSGTQSYNLADASRSIETYFGVNKKYPDGWDSLIDDSTNTIYTRIHPNLRALLTEVDLTDNPSPDTFDQKGSLNNVGIGHVFNHHGATTHPTDGSVLNPSDSGLFRHHLGTGSGHDGTTNILHFAAIDKTAGSSGYRFLMNDLGLGANTDVNAAAVPALIANNTFIVLGFGPKNTAVQSVVQQAPFLEHNNSTTQYSRAVAVFMVPNTGGGKARLVGFIGPDGRSLSDSIREYNSDPQTTAPPHN